MPLETRIAAAKIGKYATSESGDTLEIIERPHGGISIVLVDGQRSGKPAKAISNLVTRKAIALLAEGVRDGAAARAAHDYLYTYRGGRVSATLNILSVDLDTGTVVISRNSHCPVWIVEDDELCALDEPSDPVGIYARTKPIITELPLTSGMYVVAFTDGIMEAGRRYGESLNLPTLLRSLIETSDGSVRRFADSLLDAALALDRGRPNDDISVVVLSVVPLEKERRTRRLSVTFPIPPLLTPSN
jgi:serine phosphatase RsbU (regulator of sigma subunit)